MEHIKNLVDINKFKSERQDDPMKNGIDEATSRVVNLLFRELQDIFPAFRQAWPTQEDFDRAKKSWIKAFLAANINQIEQLRYGIKKCRLSSSPFAPSAGQFIDWCLPSPEDLGIPSLDAAFKEAAQSYRSESWSHEVVQHAAVQTGSFELSNWSRDKVYPVFKRNYEISIKMFAEGKLVPIPKAIEQKEPEPKGDYKRGYPEAMKEIRAILDMPERN